MIPNWDNTPRKPQGSANLFLGSTPERYEAWLRGTVEKASAARHELVLINAWNEWAEGTHLEPDLRHGRAYLEATARAVGADPTEFDLAGVHRGRKPRRRGDAPSVDINELYEQHKASSAREIEALLRQVQQLEDRLLELQAVGASSEQLERARGETTEMERRLAERLAPRIGKVPVVGSRRSNAARAATRLEGPVNAPFVTPAAVQQLTDDEWLALLCKSLDQAEVDGWRFPLFPPEDTQRNFVGASGEDALRDAVRFVRYAVDSMAEAGRPLTPDSTVVDFGCGWGRITRALLKAFEPENILGVDPLDSMVAACRDWFASSAVRFETIGTWPPLPNDVDSVDLITAFSVFSHLPESLATSWMAEFLRVLKPGGVVVATTQSRSFIALCEQMRTDPHYKDSDFLWYQLLAGSFVDADDAHRRFDAGEFLHEPNGGGAALDGATYGDSLFGATFVAERWGFLEPVRFDDKPYDLTQAVFVLRKRDGREPARAWQPGQAQVEALTRQVAGLEAELRAVRGSRTWRAGRAVLAPARLARRLRPPSPGATPAGQPAAATAPAAPAGPSQPEPRTAPSADEVSDAAASAVGLDAGSSSPTPAGTCFRPYHHAGFCPACGHDTVFDVVDPWLRDGYLCRRCGSIPRERALAMVLRQLRPNLEELVIHESSPVWRGISQHLRDSCPHYIPSYCWPGEPLGAQVEGYRNEDLERLTFADASIDVHVTQDVLEHVFDLDRANQEIERTLRPGGVHVFTTPLVNGAQPTFRRARRNDRGEVEHLAPPAVHGNPIDESGSLVTFDFGFDLPRLIGQATQLTTTVYRIDNADLGDAWRVPGGLRLRQARRDCAALAVAQAAGPTGFADPTKAVVPVICHEGRRVSIP